MPVPPDGSFCGALLPLETASRIRSNHPDSLVDFPSRLLLQMLGRNGPDVATVTKNLDVLLGGAADGGGESLDMTD